MPGFVVDPFPTPSVADPPSDTDRLSPRAAATRTYALAIGLVLASAALLAFVDLDREPTGFHLPWWGIAMLAIAAESMVFHVRFRRELHTFTFSEIPLVIGLFFASPTDLIVGRLVGEAVFLIVRERQAFRKLSLNLASFLAECVVLLVVYDLLRGGTQVDEPSVWITTLAAVASASSVGLAVVISAVGWTTGRFPVKSVLLTGVVTTTINIAFALVIALVLVTSPWATFLLSGIAVFLLVSYRSYSSLSQRYESLSLLYDFTQLVSAERNPDAVLEAMLGHAKDLLNAERAEIWLTGHEGERLRIVVDDSGWKTADLDPALVRQVDGWFGAGQDVYVAARDASNPVHRRLAECLDARGCIVAPITESGRVVGVVAVADRIGDQATFGPQDGRMFATLANHASVALENGRLIVRLHDQARQREHEALHDALTGLPNRVLFGERLRECVGMIGARGTTPAIAIMDLDGFKDINDTLGHQSGDIVLTEIARRIERIVDPAVLVARLGGDEFAFLMTSPANRAEVERQARQIVEAVAEPIPINGLSINMGISVGISVAPTDGDDAATLMQRADVAMYVAKGQADSISFYVADHDANTPRRLTLAHDLRHAIDEGQFHLVYQPKARLDDGVVVGVEALARWIHPVLGPISPDEFIPLAEKTGIMAQVTSWAVETALAQVPVWLENGLDWGVSVNLSMRNLIDTELVPTVSRLLEESGVAHERLTLEITETNVMTDPARTIDILTTFGDMGIHLSVDDFGTGYSSLSYLQRLPINEVKIDKFFVLAMSSDANAEAIVRSILDLAKHLELTVVAEGVEDQLTWNRLRELGCLTAQGYFLARPMTAADLEHWARTQVPTRSVTDLSLVRNAS
jgi:diguanylate cyclase (GGDEF)-like protein